MGFVLDCVLGSRERGAGGGVCLWQETHTHPPAMAARPAGASPPALKIKLKPRREPLPAANAQQPNSGQQTAPQQPASRPQKNEDDGKIRTLEAGSLKRKFPSPSGSPTPKRIIREESPISDSRIPVSASGEPLEVFPGKFEQLSTDPLVVKQRLGKRHASISALIQREQAVQLQGGLEDDEMRFGKARSSVMLLENISHGQLQVISVVPSSHTVTSAVSSPGKQDDTIQSDSGFRTSVDAPQTNLLTWSRSQAQGPREHHVNLLPMHAGWFAWDCIHKMERHALPQLFIGKNKLQSPEMYLQVRNAIIGKYRQNPHRPLSLSDVSGLKSVDDKEMGQILDFLIHWGLVNYQADPHLDKPGFRYPSNVPVYLEDETGPLRLVPLPLTPLEYLYQYEALRAPAVANFASSSLFGETADMAEAVKNVHVLPQALAAETYCSACGANCSKRYYYCEKQADYILCLDCYSDGKLGIGMTIGEFLLSDGIVEPLESPDCGGWTDQETLMLLEGLEMYGENWTEISEFVGTKSKAQCISHFIGMPIEDRFLEDMEAPRAFITGEGKRVISQPLYSEENANNLRSPETRVSGGSDQMHQTSGTKISSAERHPGRPDGSVEEQGGCTLKGGRSESEVLDAFVESGNPVMSLVAFLGAMVGPRVAASAAHRALSSLSEDYQASQAAVDVWDKVASERSINSCTGVKLEIPIRDTPIENNTGISRANEDKNLEVLENVQKSYPFLSRESVKKATAAALAAAAVKAKLLADQEEREVQRLAAILVDNQLKKLDVKLKQLSDIDPVLEKECEQIERNRQRLSTERRTRFMGSRLASAALPSQMPVSTTNSLNIRPAGSISGAAVPGAMLTAAGAHSSGMLRPTLYTIGPGGMAIPVTAGMVKPPS